MKEGILLKLKVLPDVHSMGWMLFDPIMVHKRHSTFNASELIHVDRGSLTIRYGRKQVSGSEGDTFLVPNGTWHSDLFDEKDGMRVFIVYFTWETERQFLSAVDPLAVPALCERIKNDVHREFEKLSSCLDLEGDVARCVACSRVHTILLMIFNEAVRRKQTHESGSPGLGARRRNDMVAKAKRFLDQHYHEQTSLESVAQVIGVSPYYLSHIFSLESDFSMHKYLTDLRMRKAVALLETGKHNVSETAYAVGFNDQKHFSRIFLRRFGVHPKDVILRKRRKGRFSKLRYEP